MPLNELGQKIACEPCIRGHRSSKCRHESDRPMFQVKRPGRPLKLTCAHKAKNLDFECPSGNVTTTGASSKDKQCVRCGGETIHSNGIQRVNSKGAIMKIGKKSVSRRDSCTVSKAEDQIPTLSSSRTSSNTPLSTEQTPSSSHPVGKSLSHMDMLQTVSQQGRGLQTQVQAVTIPHRCCLHQHGISLSACTPQPDNLPPLSCILQSGFFPENFSLTAPFPSTLHPYHHNCSSSTEFLVSQCKKS